VTPVDSSNLVSSVTASTVAGAVGESSSSARRSKSSTQPPPPPRGLPVLLAARSVTAYYKFGQPTRCGGDCVPSSSIFCWGYTCRGTHNLEPTRQRHAGDMESAERRARAGRGPRRAHRRARRVRRAAHVHLAAHGSYVGRSVGRSVLPAASTSSRRVNHFARGAGSLIRVCLCVCACVRDGVSRCQSSHLEFTR
jgi:hypothetical protein